MSLMSMGITAADVKNALDRVKDGRLGEHNAPSRNTYILCPVDQTLWDLKPVVSIILEGVDQKPREWVTQTYEPSLLTLGFKVIKFRDLKNRKLGIMRDGDAELDAELDEDHTLFRAPDGAEIKNGLWTDESVSNAQGYEIEPSELHRIFPATVQRVVQHPNATMRNSTQHAQESPDTNAIQRISNLERELAVMESRKNGLEDQKQNLTESVDDLRRRLDTSEGRVTALLSDQRPKGFWKRILPQFRGMNR